MSEPAAPPTSPPQLSAWMVALERAQARVGTAVQHLSRAAEPEVDLTAGATAVRTAAAEIYGAMDGRGDRLGDARGAMEQLDRAREALADAEADPEIASARAALEAARADVAGCEAELARIPAEPEPAHAPFCASRATIALHEVERASLAPVVRVPDPPPPPPDDLPPLERPRNVDELDATMAEVRERAERRRQTRRERAEARERRRREAEPEAIAVPEGFSGPIDPPLTLFAWSKERAREIVEEVTMLGMQRTPQLGDEWRQVHGYEQRLLANVDAFAALGAPALHTLEALVLDAPAKDPARAFAASVLLGAVAGRDALAAAERVVRFLGAEDDAVRAASVAAFKLTPHPGLGQAMRTLLGDAEPGMRALAIEVMSAHRLATHDELAAAARDEDPRVSDTALLALALEAPRHPELPQLLATACGTPERRETGWLAMALGGHPRALSEPLAHLEDEAAPLAISLVCDHDAATRLVERMTAEPTAALVEAVGWCGPIEAVVPLIDVLGQKDDALVEAAAWALDRITGAQLYEEAERDPEDVAVPDPPVPDVGDLEPPPPPLAEQISDPRDQPSEGSPDTVIRPTHERRAWRLWWRERRGDFDEEGRYRRGHRYAPSVTLWELDVWVVPHEERRRLAHELVTRSGHWVPFDPDALVLEQEQAIERWRAALASATAGGYTRPSRRT